MHKNTQIAFHDELDNIQKSAGVGDFIKKVLHRGTAGKSHAIPVSKLKEMGFKTLDPKTLDLKTFDPKKFTPEVMKKKAGIGSFLSGGYNVLGRLAGGKASLGGLKRLGTMAYRQGAAGGGGVWGGIKGVAKSQVGQAAGAVAAPVAAGYGLHKMTSD